MRTITIPKLIKKLEEDKRFARDFKTLSNRCERDRNNLLEKGATDPAAGKRFMTSWGKFVRKFPFDSASLAALMAPTSPDYKNHAGPCPTETGNYGLLSGTQILHVYQCRQQRQRKPAAKPTGASGTTKKSAKKK